MKKQKEAGILTDHEPQAALAITQLVYESKELEEILRLSKNSVNALLRSGRLRAVKYGRKYLIPRDAILEFLNGSN